MSYLLLFAAAEYMLRMPGMKSDHVCLTAALVVLILSWFDLLLLCTNHTHVCNMTAGIKARAWSMAAVVTLLLLLRCCCILLSHTDFVAARLSGFFAKKKSNRSS